MKDVFEKVNFTDYEACRQEINKYVADSTDNNIEDLLPEGSVTEKTNLILLNAAYFKGGLEESFDPAETETKMFYGSSPTNVEMMHNIGVYNYGMLFVRLNMILRL